MAIDNRYDFVMIFDVENGNPNGDPDAGNTPRVDPETNIGYITDVCIKRKIRNYVELLRVCEPKKLEEFAKNDGVRYEILIKPDKTLNTVFSEAYDSEGLPHKQKDSKKVNDALTVAKARDYMCRNYFDVRAFGAVMSTGENPCGIVRGPVQINFAKSADPINNQDVTITRQAKTNEERKEKNGDTEFGRKSIIPYALYRAEGYISAALAGKTGLTDNDLELIWDAIINMFENDHSAARGKMCMRKLYVFKHDSLLGNAPSHVLFDKVHISRKNPDAAARAFTDYEITVDEEMPNGVNFESKI